MKNYDLPEVDENASLEEIAVVRGSLAIDAKNDPEHPLVFAAHPAHKEWVAYTARLAECELAAEGEGKRFEADAAIRASVDAGDLDLDDPPEDQIKKLEATPGFIDGTLRRTDRARHDQLVAARAALYEQVHGEKPEGEPRYKTYGRRLK